MKIHQILTNFTKKFKFFNFTMNKHRPHMQLCDYNKGKHNIPYFIPCLHNLHFLHGQLKISGHKDFILKIYIAFFKNINATYQ